MLALIRLWFSAMYMRRWGLATAAACFFLVGCATQSKDKFANCKRTGNSLTCANGMVCEQASPSSMLCTGGLRCYYRDESLHCTDGTVYGKNARQAYPAVEPGSSFAPSLADSYQPPLASSPGLGSCLLGPGGLLRCSNGVSCQAAPGSGLVRCSNGLVCALDASGSMRCNNGASSMTDQGGLTRSSNGTWSITDQGGLTRRSDGSYCITDAQFGLTRCFPAGR